MIEGSNGLKGFCDTDLEGLIYFPAACLGPHGYIINYYILIDNIQAKNPQCNQTEGHDIRV